MDSESGMQSADSVLRAFIALEISHEMHQQLRQFQDELKKCGAQVGWVAPDNIHLTLVFLGDIFQAAVRQLGDGLDRVAAEFHPFSFEVAETGFFGSPRSPRVLWMGVHEPTAVLSALQEKVVACVREIGLTVEDRPFKPHLTLGRVRSRSRVEELTKALGLAKSTNCGSVEVRRLLLMQSHLEHQGVRYSILNTFALKGA